MNALITRHRSDILEITRRYGVNRVRVFGSMARDDAAEDSDVDLLVDVREGTSGFALGGLLMDLQDLFGRRVDIVTEAALRPEMRERVLREAEML